jgi:hypothetical protein
MAMRDFFRQKTEAGILKKCNKINLFVLVIFCWLLPRPASAEAPTPGIYLGIFSFDGYGIQRDGLFGIFTSDSNSAIVATFPSPSIDAFSAESSTLMQNVNIEPSGSFKTESGGVCHIGQFTNNGVSGYYSQWLGGPPTEEPCSDINWGNFIGSLLSNTGSFTAGAGFYEGSISWEVTLLGENWADISGDLFVMISGDGSAFITVDACAIHGPTCTIADDGGFLQVSGDGEITGQLLAGTYITGSVNLSELETSSCCSAEGTFYRENGDYIASGSWSLSRTIPLPISVETKAKSIPWIMLLLD